jgi:hypothetical protein
VPLTVAQLGFQSAGNYCNNTPKPATCTITPFTDAPVWVTAPQTFDGVNYVAGTLRGNSLPGVPAPTRDTSGAYGWFVPTVPVRSMDLLFGPRDGLPNYQLFLAAAAPGTVISGTVTLGDQPAGTPIPPGTIATLEDSSGTPVPGIDDQPVTTPVAPDGTFTFQTEQRDDYEITITPPPGLDPPPPVVVPADTAEVTVPPIALTATPVPPPATTAPTTPVPTTAAPATTEPPSTLPATGADPWPVAAGAATLALVGLAITWSSRRRPRLP